MNHVAVLVPLRPFGEGKTRLAAGVDERTRATLAERWARKACLAARAGDEAAALFIVGRVELATFANEVDAELLAEPAAGGLASSVDHALDLLAARGFTRALVLMGDLPDVRPEDVRACLDADADVVLAESRSGEGTNALALPLPRPFDTSFGDPRSRARHERSAEDAAKSLLRVRLEGLVRDVDVVADLVAGDLPTQARDR